MTNDTYLPVTCSRRSGDDKLTWTSVAAEHTAAYRAYLFGPTRLYRGAADLTAGQGVRRKAMEILVWFLLNPGRPCSAEELVEELWPDDDPNRTLGSFHVGMHKLRRLLEPGLGSREESKYLRRHSSRVYSFNHHDEWWVDVEDLESLYEWGHQADRRGDAARAKFCFHRIGMHVARGQLLEGSTAPWLEAVRTTNNHISQQALTRLIELEQVTGGPDAVMESAYLALRVDKFNSLAVRVVIESFLARGQRSAAQEMLAAYRSHLHDELGLPVSQEVLELDHAIRSGRYAADLGPLAARVTAPEIQRHSVLLRAS